MKQKEESLNSVEKALKILLAFQAEQPSWGVRELSQQLGFSPATVQRILQTLKSYDFVSQDSETRRYYLGKVSFNYIKNSLYENSIQRVAQAFMKRLLDKTQETVHLNIIQDNIRLCIDCMESPQNLKGTMKIGTSTPLYAGGTPKCLLAFSASEMIESYFQAVTIKPFTRRTIVSKKALREELKKIKAQGYAKSLGERSEGLGSISAPVFGNNEEFLCCLSLAIPEVRFINEDYLNKCIRELLNATYDFSRVMGYQK